MESKLTQRTALRGAPKRLTTHWLVWVLIFHIAVAVVHVTLMMALPHRSSWQVATFMTLFVGSPIIACASLVVMVMGVARPTNARFGVGLAGLVVALFVYMICTNIMPTG